MEGSKSAISSNTSHWWKDLLILDAGHDLNWLNSEVSRKVGSGSNTSF
jgi:hypothetical protein